MADVAEQAVHDKGSEIPAGLNGLSSIDARRLPKKSSCALRSRAGVRTRARLPRQFARESRVAPPGSASENRREWPVR